MIEAVAYVTMLMFADNKDAATVMSKSCGGGGSSLESGCDKKDDEDGWKVAHRCVQMTHSMCKLLKTEDIHPPKTGISVHFSGSLV